MVTQHIMQLPSLFGKPKKVDDRFFLSLFLADHVLQAGLWTVDHGRVSLLTTSAPHEYEAPEGAINQADAAFQELGPDSEQARKIVFGFEPSWIEHTGVRSTHKAFLKKLTTELNLEPVGFVSLTESVLQQVLQRSVMLSAIVTLIHGKQLFGYLLKEGKVLAESQLGRTEDHLADVKKLFGQLGKLAASSDHYLPTTLIFVPTHAIDSAAAMTQPLQSFDWGAELPFVSSPELEFVPPSFVIQAITEQGGLAVAKAEGIITAESAVQAHDLNEPSSGNDEVVPPIEPPTTLEPTASEIGSSFGIALPATSTKPLSNIPTEDPEPEISQSENVVAFSHTAHPLVIKKVVVVSVLAGLVAVIVIGMVALWMMFSVQVQAQLATGSVAKDVKITLDPKAKATDPDNLILKAELVSLETKGAETAATTGVKLVGDKASGVIKIFNKTTSVKTFTKGTELTSGAIKFSLQDDVEVASASVTSSVDSEIRDYGEAEAKVGAVDIGADANLAKDTVLKIAAFDANTYSAVVKEGLTGGSSREVRVVSPEDRQKLLKSLTDTLSKKAEAEFKTNSTDGKFMLPTGRLIQSTSKFDAEVGKETETLGLDLTAQFEGIQYTREDLKPLVIKVLGGEVKAGHKLSETDPQILSAPDTSTAGSSSSAKVVLAANITAQTEPVVNPTEVSEQIKGLPTQEATEKLQSTGLFKTIDVTFMPSLAKWLVGRLPSQINRINFTVVKP